MIHGVRAGEKVFAARTENKKRVILFNLSGHGLMDMAAHEAFTSGHLKE